MSMVGRVYTAELAQYLDLYLSSYRQRVTTLEEQRDALEVRSAVYTDLKSRMSTLRSLAEELSGTGTLSAFGAKATTSGDADILTATASAGAVYAATSCSNASASSRRWKRAISASWDGTGRFCMARVDSPLPISLPPGPSRAGLPCRLKPPKTAVRPMIPKNRPPESR